MLFFFYGKTLLIEGSVYSNPYTVAAPLGGGGGGCVGLTLQHQEGQSIRPRPRRRNCQGGSPGGFPAGRFTQALEDIVRPPVLVTGGMTPLATGVITRLATG